MPYCQYPFIRLRITCEGDVSMCCFQAEKTLGNLFNTDLMDLWNSPLAQEIRKSVSGTTLHKSCDVPCPFRNMKTNFPIVFSNYPSSLEIDLPNTHCNIGGENPNPNTACIMCERADVNFVKQTNRLNEVIDKLYFLSPHLNHMHIQGVAEPFYKDQIFDVINRIPIQGYISTTTNGVLFNQSRMDLWIERCPKSIITFSLDAATPETYKTIRRVDLYDKVINHLIEFSKRRTSTQRLRIHNNINNINVRELVGMVHIAAQAKVDEIEFNLTGGHCRTILVSQATAHIFRNYQYQAEQEAKKLGVNLKILTPLDGGFTNTISPKQRISLL